jgi:serine/threonine protein kinase
MTSDGNAPTIPDTAAPTHGARQSGSLSRAPEDRYVLRTMLGAGGMGEVWLAHDVRIDREIAIKMMRGRDDPDAVARFLREARVQGRLEHPSVVPVHDLGPEDNPYFAMKRLTGTTLEDVIGARDKEQWNRRKLLTRFIEVCLAVEFAHRRGVIHRDLKPANIMVGNFGETYVLDWGLARIADDAPEQHGAISGIQTADLRSDSGNGQTQAGALLGTPGYMPPEQMRGEVVGVGADVFALGCILFEILAGVPAIARDKAFEVTLATAAYHPAQRRPEAEIPPELDGLVARATAADVASRPASARELADAVQRFLDGDRDHERRRELAVEHAARATAAFATSGDAGRAEAMREAGRAIALDPANDEAQKLLVTLMLKIPDKLPAGAQQALLAERYAATREVLRIGARAYFANLLVIPLCKLIGIGGTWPFIVVGAITIVQVVLCAGLARRERPLTRATWVLLLANHVLLLTVVGTFFGSLLFVPIFALGSLPNMLMLPQIYNPIAAFLVHALAIALPVTLELTGVIPPSFRIDGNGLVFQPWAVDITPKMIVIVLLAIVAIQLWVTTRLLTINRRSQERAHELLHAQRWQLDQIVRTE